MIARVQGDDPERHLQRVGGAQLSWLHYGGGVLGQRFHYLIGVRLNHHHRLCRFEKSHRVQNPLDHRPTGYPVNHFGKDRLHTRPLPLHPARLPLRPWHHSFVRLGGQESNPYRRDQNPLCCRLHHPHRSVVSGRWSIVMTDCPFVR